MVLMCVYACVWVGTKGKVLIYETSTLDCKALMLIVGRLLYVVQISMKKSATDKSPMDDFIISFKLP